MTNGKSLRQTWNDLMVLSWVERESFAIVTALEKQKRDPEMAHYWNFHSKWKYRDRIQHDKHYHRMNWSVM